MLPHDQRNFVHKRLFGAAGGFLTGGPGGALRGFAGGGSRRSGGQPTAPAVRRFDGRALNASRGLACGPGMVPRGRNGACIPDKKPGVIAAIQRAVPGGATGRFQGAGEAVLGQFGAGLAPFVEDRMVRSCLPGMVLGKDGLCYNRRDISNKEREYPKGTRPLGTPGEMAALRKAASFGRRMETTVKRMQKIGVLKTPKRGRSAPRRAPRQLLPGGTSIVNVE